MHPKVMHSAWMALFWYQVVNIGRQLACVRVNFRRPPIILPYYIKENDDEE